MFIALLGVSLILNVLLFAATYAAVANWVRTLKATRVLWKSINVLRWRAAQGHVDRPDEIVDALGLLLHHDIVVAGLGNHYEPTPLNARGVPVDNEVVAVA